MSNKKQPPSGLVSGLGSLVGDFVREVKQDLRDMTPPEHKEKKPLIGAEAVATVRQAQAGVGEIEAPMVERESSYLPPSPPLGGEGESHIIDPWALVDTPTKIQVDAAFIASDAAAALRYGEVVSREYKEPKTIGVVYTEGRTIDDKLLKLLRRAPRLFAGVGWGPRMLEKDLDALDEKLTTLLNDNPRVIAVGLLGLDEPYAPYKLNDQIAQLKLQLEIAADFGLPALIGHRKSFEPLRKVLTEAEALPSLIWAEPLAGEDELALVNELQAMVLVRPEITYPENRIYRELLKRVPVERRLLACGSSLVAASSRSGHTNGPEGLPLSLKAYTELLGQETSASNIRGNQAALSRNAQRLYLGHPQA